MGKNDVDRVGTPTQRLWRRTIVNPTTGCYEWQGATNDWGYGTIWVDGKDVFVHRFAHELFVGPIPAGHEIDHDCRTRNCWRPDHLEAVTRRDNILRGEGAGAINARRTHCAQGHEFTPANTYIWRGYRHCKACNAKRQRARRAARKKAA